MSNEELKKKIVEIIINAIWKDAEADYDSTDETEACSIADALIEAGLTFEPIIIHTVELPDECEKKIHELLKEEEASIEKITHRAFDAERAVQDWANASLDYTYYDAMEQAEKEFAEEGKDD